MNQRKTFFDILEEVIKEKTTDRTVVGFKGSQDQRYIGSNTNELMNQ